MGGSASTEVGGVRVFKAGPSRNLGFEEGWKPR